MTGSFLHTAAKRGIEAAAVHTGLVALVRRRMAGRTVVLSYHNVVPDHLPPAGDRSLHLPLAAFLRHLDQLARTHDVVPLAEARDVGRARPAAVITFDDAYAGALRLAVPELVRRGMAATIFVAPGCLGGRGFWWDLLSPEGGDAVPPAFREAALTSCGGDHGSVLALGHSSGLRERELPEMLRSADESEVVTASRLPGITLAAHSWTHPNLAAVEQRRLEDELTRPLDWLRAHAGQWRPELAYPYGLDSAAAQAAASQAGYQAAWRVTGGWLTERSESFALPRLAIPSGLSADGFAMRLAGLLVN